MTTQPDDELWSAIADPSRRRVLDLLVSNGEVSASWLAGHVPFSRQGVSKHLVVLEEAGLVSRRKQGSYNQKLWMHHLSRGAAYLPR
ncbi:MAG: ArsR/SmtB family transcription factor [Acidimicrobiales bacterium]